MSVYHIKYTPEKKHLYLFINNGCDFSCHGCITEKHPADYHLSKTRVKTSEVVCTDEEVIEKMKDLPIEKVTFLGKEPVCDPEFYSLARKLKKRFKTYNILITNGYSYPDHAVEWLDEVCVSIKAITPKIFSEFTGQDCPERVIRNLKKYATHQDIRVRTESVMIPGFIDEEEILLIAAEIAKIGQSIPYRIDGYIPFGADDRFDQPSREQIAHVRERAQQYLETISLLHKNTKPTQHVEVIY